jgi:hypothetical protein
MISYLITGGDQQQRLEKTQQFFVHPRQAENKTGENCSHHPDVLIVEAAPSVRINQIRQIKKFLSRKPYQADTKTVIVPQAQLMTLPSQNAFLKTLEELPAHSQIILCAPQKEDLLPTIISRCQIINLKPKPTTIINRQKMTVHCSLFTKILKSSPGQRLQLIEPYTKNREEAINFCQEMIFSLRSLLLNSPEDPQLLNHSITQLLQKLRQAIFLLQANVNVKLVLENLSLSL